MIRHIRAASSPNGTPERGAVVGPETRGLKSVAAPGPLIAGVPYVLLGTTTAAVANSIVPRNDPML
jgi:hypothetical protein